jgi:prevent-host-death family protein
MSTVGVSELKNHLTRYLRETKNGGVIVITERGNPIAVIRPIRVAKRGADLETRLASLAARGAVTRPTRRPRKRIRRITVKGHSVSRAVLEDRR